MESDYEKIMTLLRKNDYFFNRNLIQKEEYIYNNLFLASRLETLLRENERFTIQKFLSDDFSLAKFKLSILSLKTVIN